MPVAMTLFFLFERKVHFESQLVSATVALPTHFTGHSFEGPERDCLMQTRVMKMSVQSIRLPNVGSKALPHEVYDC